jgi:hypothetical protein
MGVKTVRLALATAMGLLIVLLANNWYHWMPHNKILLAAGALSFALAISLGAYRMKFLEEKFGVLEIPAIWEGELIQGISWDVVAYASIFAAVVIGGVIAFAVTPMLPLSLIPLTYILCMGCIILLRLPGPV